MGCLTVRQRGFALVALLPYALGALAVAGLLYAAYRWVDGNWETTAGIAEGKRLMADQLQPQLDACDRSLGQANVRIATQSAAIQQQAQAQAEAAKAAQRLAEAARQANAGARAQSDRLNELIRKGVGPGDCPAGRALAEIRKGWQK